MNRGWRWPLAIALVANGLVIGALVYAALIGADESELYQLSVQEDEYLEWATFWAFLAAAGVFLACAARQRQAKGGVPWFLAGVALFTFFVAMEEISWAQRLLGYRPPVYFLEHNFQQELNFHNVTSTELRKLAVKGVLLGYGVLLPLLALAPPARKLMERLRIEGPPLSLAPAFLAAFVAYASYPWSHTGEWVEYMMGAGFLFAGILVADRLAGAAPAAALVRIGVAWVGVVLLGVGVSFALDAARRDDPQLVAAAAAETEALRQDFRSGRVRTRCGIHKRVYSFVEKYDGDFLYQGRFAGLVAQGLPEDRAKFFLDPWNSPYWIRDKCKKMGGRRETFVYSFGPNRRRESSDWEIRGDDVGAIVRSDG